MLKRFLKIYTWTVIGIIVLLVAAGLYYMFAAAMPYRAYLCFFIAVLAVFILFVTRSMGRKNVRRRS